MTGLFVVFECMDGSGKGTQMHLTAKWLYDLNKRHHVVLTREPGRSDYGARVREIMAMK